jgi:hypothetical protein
MRFMRVINRLLFVTAVLGIILGPISIGAADSAMAASGPSVMAPLGMLEDMPCCPDPIKPDCGKTCPLAVLCATAIVSHLACEQAWLTNPTWISHDFMPVAHSELAATAVDPPVRPPRI